MNLRSKASLCFVAASSMLVISAAEAFAWSCQATADDGTYGYSYNYPNRRGARQRALAECNARTYDQCWVVDCQRNG